MFNTNTCNFFLTSYDSLCVVMTWEDNYTWLEHPSLTIFSKFSLDVSSALKTN